MRKQLEDVKKWFEHIVEKYPKDSVIGIDPRLLTAGKLSFILDSGIVRVAYL